MSKPGSSDIGRWLSAALDDPNVCDEMKADISAWMAENVMTDQVGRIAAAIADLTDEEIIRTSRIMTAIVCHALRGGNNRSAKAQANIARNVTRDAATVLAIATGAVI